uniref:Neuropeptide n=1 Tax=Panagrellus redivivus TaxID=6233 RepID=A0A7E4W4F0_PANRE
MRFHLKGRRSMKVLICAYVFAAALIFVAAQSVDDEILEQRRQILERLFGGVAKRRTNRELLGKRALPGFERESRRARELWGKRSVSSSPIDFPSNDLVENWGDMPQKRMGRELFGKRSADHENMAYLMSLVNSRRDRRARTSELFG